MDVRLEFEIHGEIGMRPVTTQPETNEIFLLFGDLACCVLAASGTERGVIDLRPALPIFFSTFSSIGKP